jgi:D-arabinitol dehydrogenase (NADP+)
MKMRAVVYEEPRKFSIKSVEIPKIKPNQVLIKVYSCGICRTDAHIHEGDFISRFPLTPGHEFAGEIVEVGSETEGFKIGDRVTADNTVMCGNCYYCRRNQPLFCENFYSLGCNGPGGFAEYVVVNYDKVFHICDSLSYDQACFSEPISCAIHGMDVINVKCGDDVLIFGAGPTGILLTQLIKYGGAANIVVCASSQNKLDLIKKNGYAKTVLMDRNDYSKHRSIIKEQFPGGFDIVIDATGAPQVLEQCFDFPRNTGKIVVYGVAPSDSKISVNPYQIFQKELKILGSFAQSHCFDRAVKYLEEGIIKVDDLVSNHYSLEQFPEAIDQMLNGKGQLKIIVHPNKE